MPELQTYNRKRNFKSTTEPRGRKIKESHRDFMIHMHDARKLHYDVRLEWNGVLLSWAVPKGPSLNPEDKRLAVRTEDHPVEYKAFEGMIPEKSYGAGPSMIWEAGTWRPLVENVGAALKKGRLRFYLRGVRLRGVWNLIRMHGKGKDTWLMIKEDDKYASKTWTIEDHTTSVATGRTVDDIASSTVDIYNSKDDSKKKVKNNPPKDDNPFKYVEFTAAPPGDVKKWRPQMATLATKLPASMKDWIVEKKYDGYRIVAIKQNERVTLLTRNGNDWSKKMPALCRAVAALPVEQIVLDGELVAYDGDDKNESFQTLQNFLKDEKDSSMRFFVFDILSLENADLRQEPQWFRRNVVENLFEKMDSTFLKLSETYIWKKDLLVSVCKEGREGIILKHRDSKYEGRRSKNWLKLKCGTRDEYLVVGWTKPKGTRTHFGALLLAEDVGGKLEYRGKVGTGFDGRLLKSTLEKINDYATETCPIGEDCEDAPEAHWVQPHYYAEIRFTEISRDKRLRQPVFLGLRKDKFYNGTKKEKAVAAAKRKKTPVRRSKKTTSKTTIELSHPDKVLFPDMGVTKADLLEYYSSVYKEFMKLGQHRPLSLVRCPNGSKKQCFFQKHMDVEGEHPPQVEIETKHSTGKYPYIDSFDDLASIVQLGTLELHGWNCTVEDTDKPQYVVWDLDPGEGVRFGDITQTAHLARLILKEKGFDAFVRTSGGKGLHVLARVEDMTWEESKAFSKEIGEYMVEARPDFYLLNSKKSIRKNHIFIDYLRNSKSATSILSFSPRARPGAPVSYPLEWSQVKDTLDPLKFNIKTVPQLLKKRKKDPWQSFYRSLK